MRKNNRNAFGTLILILLLVLGIGTVYALSSAIPVKSTSSTRFYTVDEINELAGKKDGIQVMAEKGTDENGNRIIGESPDIVNVEGIITSFSKELGLFELQDENGKTTLHGGFNNIHDYTIDKFIKSHDKGDVVKLGGVIIKMNDGSNLFVTTYIYTE